MSFYNVLNLNWLLSEQQRGINKTFLIYLYTSIKLKEQIVQFITAYYLSIIM